MPTLPRLKNSDNLNQWASKVNEGFEQLEVVAESTLTTVDPINAGEFIVYWGQYSLTNTNKTFGTHYNTDSPYQNLGDLTVTIPLNNHIVRDITIIDPGINYSTTPFVTVSNPYLGSTGFPGATGTTINSVVGSTGFNVGTVVSSAFSIPGATGVSYKFYKATTAIPHNSIVPLHSNGLANNWLFIGRNARVSVTVGSGGITGKTVNDGGYGYSSLPTITITPTGGGTGAVLAPEMYSDVIAGLTVGSIENKPEITSLTDTTRAMDFLLVYDSTSLKKIKISTITPDIPTGSVLFGSPTDSYTWDSTNFHWDDSNNRLGLGTNTPDALLTVAGVGAFGDGATGFPSITNTGDLDTGFWFPLPNTIAASTGGLERVRITSTGEIGIGTISPDALLTVAGVGAFGDGATGFPSITNTGDLDTGFWFPLPNTIAASTGGLERVRIDSSGNVAIGTSTTSNGTFTVINSVDSSIAFLNLSRTLGGSADGVYILDDRGISGVNSSKTLRVVSRNDGLNDTGAIASFETLGGATNTVFRIGMDYNVGVGTSTPAYALDIKSLTGNTALKVTNAGANDNVQIRFQGNQSNVEQWSIGNNVATGGTGRNFDIFDVVSSTNRLRIDSTGNIGIGTNSPLYKVDVVGDANISTGSIYRINGTSVLSSTTLGSGVLFSSLTTLGTITTGTWNATVIAGQYGGTGVNNAGRTITLGGNLTTSGAFALTLTLSNTTNLNLPTTGTLATLAGAEALTNKTYNNVNITTPASPATLTISSGKTLTVSNTLTFNGNDSSSIAFGSGGTVLYTASNINIGTTSIALNRASGAQTLTGVSIDGNAGAASKLTTSKNITFSGDVSGVLSTDFAGDTTVNLTVTSATSVTSAISVNGPVLSGTASHNLVNGTMADNDYFRIRVSGTASNSGFVEFATADDGTEPIHFRQYSGVFTTLLRTATILDASGNTSFPGSVTASVFSGSGASLNSIPNSATTATSTNTINAIVTRDASGNFSAGTITATLSGNASSATTASSITGQANSATITATSSNVANQIVLRDGSGNFSAGTITATTFSGSGASLNSIPNSATTATSTNTINAIVTRDASGNFSAGTITATLSGNASSATTLQTNRTFSLTGNVTATAVSFNGSGNVSLTTVIGSGVVTNDMLAGSIANNKLLNSSITINGTLVSLGGTITVASVGGSNTQVQYNSNGTLTGSANMTFDGTRLTVAALTVTGNLTGTLTGNASSATTASSITGQANSATITATSSNVANQIVLRDGSGNFSAGSVSVGSLTSNGTTVSIGSISARAGQSSGSIANATGSLGGIEVLGGGGSNAAFMSFHRPGVYAAYFGMDSDNQFKFGGWSMGSISYVILHSGNHTSYSPSLTGSGASGTWGINITGNATTATTANTATTATTATSASSAVTLSSNQSNWSTNGTISAVVGQLAWKHYGNGHTIFDASNGTSPSGTSISNTNPAAGWQATYPTLMAWNGTTTHGVRVDSARVADSATIAGSITNQANSATITASVGIASNTIVQRDTNGHINNIGAQVYSSYYNSVDDVSGGNITNIMAKFGDNFIRSATAAKVASFISGQSMNIAGNATTATTANSINNQANSATITATSSNVANQIVLRDASGNFTAGTITATLSGNASTATTTTNVSGGSVSATTGSFSGKVSGSGSSYRLVLPVGTDLWAT